MASQDKNVGPSLASPRASQMGPWEAILEAAREQLPSLDSDSSLSDCGEEELFIFQRNQSTLIPDLSEELVEDPDGAWMTLADRSPEPLVVPVDFSPQPWGDWNARTKEGWDPGQPLESCGGSSSLLRMPEETPMCQEGNRGGMSFNIKGSPSPPWGLVGEATLCLPGQDLRKDPNDASCIPEGFDSGNRRALRRERRKRIERDLLHKVTWGAQNPACNGHSQVKEMCKAAAAGPSPGTLPPQGPQEGWPVLSLQQLEEWDLDHILQSLTEQEDNQGDFAPGAVWWAADHLQGRGHAEPSAQDRLMEQLTLLCVTKSRASSSAWKEPPDMPQDTEQLEARSRQANQSLSPGIVERGERPAVVINTKAGGAVCFGRAEPVSAKAPSRASHHLHRPEAHGAISPGVTGKPRPRSSPSPSLSPSPSCSSSDSEEAEEEETAALRTQQGPARLRDCTGKSQLLQQLRAFRKGMYAQPQLPVNKGPRSQKAQVPEDTAGSGTGRKQHVIF